MQFEGKNIFQVDSVHDQRVRNAKSYENQNRSLMARFVAQTPPHSRRTIFWPNFITLRLVIQLSTVSSLYY